MHETGATAETGAQARKRALTTIVLEPRRRGRPHKYSVELGLLVCEKMIEYGGLAAACRDNDEMPDRITVYRWMNAYPDFEQHLSRARERLIERMADDMIALADDDTLEPNDRRIRIETRRWIASKWNARRYGDKIVHSGDPDNPMVVLHKAVTVEALSEPELVALEAFALARANATDAEAEEPSTINGLADMAPVPTP